MTLLERPTSIGRRYLHDEAVERLRQLILAGELEPRSRINEAALCERFGISRTPLREAIKLLAADGLLDLLPNRGARVSALSGEEIADVFEVLAALEDAAGELACTHIRPDELAELEALQVRMEDAHRRQDAPTYFAINRQVHETIMAASRNPTLQDAYARLSGRIQRARYSATKTPAQWAEAVSDHAEMLKHLRARDGRALGALLRRHVRGKKTIVAAAFGEEQGSRSSAGRL